MNTMMKSLSIMILSVLLLTSQVYLPKTKISAMLMILLMLMKKKWLKVY